MNKITDGEEREEENRRKANEGKTNRIYGEKGERGE